MQIDRRSLEKLLSMNDRQLQSIITRLAAESGIDVSTFNVDPKDIASVRRALSTATDEDLRRVTEQYEQFKKGGKVQK